MAIGTMGGKFREPMGNIARTAALSSDVIVTTTGDGITSETMTAIEKSSSSAEATSR
jgi:hypothetical protein